MGLSTKDIPVCLCRMIQVSIETSFTFMRRHPLISGVLILLIIVYLFLSYIYHFLVYLSPFLVCAAFFVCIFWSSEQDPLKYIKGDNKKAEQRKFDRQYTEIPSHVKRDLALQRRYSLRNATSRRRNFKDKKWNAQDIVVEETNKVLPTITNNDSEDNNALSTITSNDSENNKELSTLPINNDSDENKEATSSDPEPPTSDLVKISDSDQQTSRTDGSDGSALEKENENSREGEGGESQEEGEVESLEEEEEGEDSQEEANKAMEWTNDDQKNLMDLGISEIERNRRLESLIARRRARQHLKLQIEKGIIDLRTVSPSQIAPLLITRINTTSDYRRGEYEGIDGIEIPGSAPSVLRPSRNPFDLPYDPSEEKPNLTGDSFQQEFTVSHHQREMSYCRHESFNIGPSLPFDESYPFFINGRKISDRFRRLPEKGNPDLIIEKLFCKDSVGGSVGFSTRVKAPKPLLTKLQPNEETPTKSKLKFDLFDLIIKRKQEDDDDDDDDTAAQKQQQSESKPMSEAEDGPKISNDEKAGVSEAPPPPLELDNKPINEKFLNFPITTSSSNVVTSISESLPFESPSSSKNQENVLFSDRCIFHKPTCSIASDLQVEFSEVGSPTTLTIDGEESVVFDGDGGDIDKDIIAIATPGSEDFGEDLSAEVSNSSSKSIASLIPLQQIDEEEDTSAATELSGDIFCNESLPLPHQTQSEIPEERQEIPENSRTDSTTIDTQDLDRNEDPGPSIVNRALIDAVAINPFSLFSPRSVLPEKIRTDQVSLPAFDQHIRTNVPQLNREDISQPISTNDLVPNTMPHNMQPLMVDPVTQTQSASSSNSQGGQEAYCSSTVADDEDERENNTLVIPRNKEPYDPPEDSIGKAHFSEKENDVEEENSNNTSRKVVDDGVTSSSSKVIEKIGNSTTTIEDDAELAQSMDANPPKLDKLNESLEKSEAEIINKEEIKEESSNEVPSEEVSNVQSESTEKLKNDPNDDSLEKLSNVQSESEKNDAEMSNKEEDKEKSKNEVPLNSDKPDSSKKENDAVIYNKEDEENLKNGENSKDKTSAELEDQEEVNNVHSNSGKNDAQSSNNKEEDKESNPEKPKEVEDDKEKDKKESIEQELKQNIEEAMAMASSKEPGEELEENS